MGETLSSMLGPSLSIRELHHDPIEVLGGRVQSNGLVQPKGWDGDVPTIITTSLHLASCQ